MLRAALCSLVLFACTSGCTPLEPDDEDATTGTTGAAVGEPQATIVGKVDLIDLCGAEGAQAVTFLARKVGCEPGPPAPCTLKIDPYLEYSGDLMPCPSSQTSLEMEVAIPATGRFHIEARTTTGSGTLSRCYGRGGDLPTVVTSADLDARARIFVETTAAACPPPG